MKNVPENFADLAQQFTDGMSVTHAESPHSENDCIVWQNAISEFARWLDAQGYLLENSNLELTT
jgi:hypothetical protein